MKQPIISLNDGKKQVVKLAMAGLLPVAGYTLAVVVAMARGLVPPGTNVLEVLLLPIAAYVFGFGYVAVRFLRGRRHAWANVWRGEVN